MALQGKYFEIGDHVPSNGQFPDVLGPFSVTSTVGIAPSDLTIEWGPASTWATTEKVGSFPRRALREAQSSKFAEQLPEVIQISTSPLHPITLAPGDRAAASIPETAEHFIFCYPFNFEKGSFPSGVVEDEDPDAAFLTVGGFAYFDGSLRALSLNALMKSTEGSISFGKPKDWQPGWTESLQKHCVNFHSVTLPAFTDTGASSFVWLKPHTVVGGAISQGGQAICPHGGFAYIFEPRLVAAEPDEPKPVAAEADDDLLDNILMLSDSYKITHHLQYPPDTQVIYSYFESRGGAYRDVCFFGLQYFLKKYLVGEVVTMQKIDQAESYFRSHFSDPVHGYNESLFNRAGWEYIVKRHGGKLPVTIKAVPEGTVVPYKNVIFTMENTDPQCFWLSNFLETLLVQVWYPTTVCTQSREQKKIIMRYLRETGCSDVIDNGGHLFKLHDFGFRGVSSTESAAIGCCGHLVNFMGTDTMAGLVVAKEHYSESAAGFAIPASEHSTMTSWGRAGEVDAYRNMLTKYPSGVVAIVSDSYDVFNACENLFGGELKAMIEERNGRLVVRPDSGELPKIVLDVLDKLASKFTCTTTATGHKLLPDCIRVLQGDGVDINTLEVILGAMKEAGWAADNLAFGSGGALLQKLHRDTQKFAFKCSHALVGGVGRDVVKDPITDPGKRSKMGRLTLERSGDEWTTITEGRGDAGQDELVEVFRDGALLVDHTFAAIRARSNGELVATERLSVPRTLGVKGDPLNNILMLTDSYKVSHHLQYPPGTQTIYSYFESRGGAHEDMVFFGLQYFMRKYLMGQVVTMGKIDQAEAYFKVHFSQPGHGYNEALFNRKNWEYIVEKHGGRLPISIKAVPEGMVVPYKNVLFTLENTDPECFWLTNYLETLLVQVWYATTVCTQSREQKKIIMKGLRDTGCGDVIDKNGHLFKLHDFGFRGVSSVESAAVGSVGHLVNFRGSDTLVGLMLAKDHYSESCAGYSVPASEHSTMTSWGRAGEVDAYRNMLTKYPSGVVSVVSDSYDVFNACENLFGGELREMIEKRGGQLVVRPDSGELPKVILDVLDKLASKFTCSTTSTGHKLLPDCIRVLQGDGINIDSLAMIIAAMKDAGWAADNLAFGSGGALLQKLHRDTQKFAFKCSYALIGGVGRDVIKDPITDPGKKSKMGRLTLEKGADNKFVTVVEGKGDPTKDFLVEVFKDGKVLVQHTLSEIRERAAVGLD